MAYDDGFYFGQARVICLGTKDADNEKRIRITGDDVNVADLMRSRMCEFILPGKARYHINFNNGEYETDINVSYGECIGVYMNKDYDIVHFADLAAYVKIADLQGIADLTTKSPTELGDKSITAVCAKDMFDFENTTRTKADFNSVEINKLTKRVDTNATNISTNSSSISTLQLRAKSNETEISTNRTMISDVQNTITQMKQTFMDGVNTIYNAIVRKGVTPTDKTPSACADAIARIGGSGGSGTGYIKGYIAPVLDPVYGWVSVFYMQIEDSNGHVIMPWFEQAVTDLRIGGQPVSEDISWGTREKPAIYQLINFQGESSKGV